MSKLNQASLYVVCMIVLLTVLGCGKKEIPKGKVSFSEPADGAEIKGKVKVVMGVEGKEIKPAGEIVEGTGHHHILINKGLQVRWSRRTIITSTSGKDKRKQF